MIFINERGIHYKYFISLITEQETKAVVSPELRFLCFNEYGKHNKTFREITLQGTATEILCVRNKKTPLTVSSYYCI